ncbi:MAG: hypothetical protein ABI359_00885 [Ginsengibacter sp.]
MNIRKAVIDDIKQIQRVRNSVTENTLSEPNLVTVYIPNNNRMKI